MNVSLFVLYVSCIITLLPTLQYYVHITFFRERGSKDTERGCLRQNAGVVVNVRHAVIGPWRQSKPSSQLSAYSVHCKRKPANTRVCYWFCPTTTTLDYLELPIIHTLQKYVLGCLHCHFLVLMHEKFQLEVK